ncbi:hypothetical protein BABINDRAFT_167795 [Babjeviella inositovora NRRL Y-12698]|uniref:DNA mismatch repair protein HSM3 n=1 Tax=Babjeviella inositovora NRRL Y-12698 TaxID=984486 RepID=A0A1E3QNL2_9ASCO|nr:uncharacterized protein BABINDRAFT_167795 [Babjeviella inositovora NRRL Y-12698]ODQ79275.1 hypothetical protein BABINDRAFT_167795 [Babjeviella inositovora NRRL Y-12698]
MNSDHLSVLTNHISKSLELNTPLDEQLIHSALSELGATRITAADFGTFPQTVYALIDSPHLATVDPNLAIRNVISAVLSLTTTFETVSTLVPLPLVLKGLKAPPFQKLIIEDVVARSGDYLAGTEVYRALGALYFDPETALDIVELIQNTLVLLVKAPSNHLVRRRIGSSADVAQIIDAVVLTGALLGRIRLMDLMLSFLPLFPESQFATQWYTHQPSAFQSEDVLFVGNLIRYYTGLLDIVGMNREIVFPEGSAIPMTWLLKRIDSQIDILGEMYAQRASNEDVEMFYVNELTHFLARLSYVDPVRMEHLDRNYTIVDGSELLLSMADPAYLYSQHKTLVEDAVLSAPALRAKLLPVFLNLLLDARWFGEIAVTAYLGARSLNALQYDQVFRVMDALTRTEYGVRFMVGTPFLMNDYVLSNRFGKEATGVVLSQEMFQVKRTVLDRLMGERRGMVEGGIWWEKLCEYYKVFVTGEKRGEAQPAVFSTTG